MMKTTAVVLATIFATALAHPADTYNPKYDNFNYKEVIENHRLLKNMMNCFLDKGPCTPEAADFKKVIPEALQTQCAKCTEKQSEIVRTIVKAFEAKLPDQWNELIKKHDPTGKYRASFKEFLNASA